MKRAIGFILVFIFGVFCGVLVASPQEQPRQQQAAVEHRAAPPPFQEASTVEPKAAVRSFRRMLKRNGFLCDNQEGYQESCRKAVGGGRVWVDCVHNGAADCESIKFASMGDPNDEVTRFEVCRARER